MSKTEKTTATKAVEAVKQPVESWRGTVAGSDKIAPRPQRHYRTRLFLGYTSIAVVVFVVLAFLAKTTAYFTFDVTITRAVQTFNVAWFSALMYALTWIGFSPQAWIISVGVIVFLLDESAGLTQWGLFALAAWPFAIRPMERVGAATGRDLIPVLVGTALTHATFGLLLSLGLVLWQTMS